MSPLSTSPKADQLLACSVPAGFWGAEGMEKGGGRETARREKMGKGNKVKGWGMKRKGSKGKGREEEEKAKGRREGGSKREQFCAVVIFPGFHQLLIARSRY